MPPILVLVPPEQRQRKLRMADMAEMVCFALQAAAALLRQELPRLEGVFKDFPG